MQQNNYLWRICSVLVSGSLEYLTKPFLTITGTGTVSFVDGLTDSVHFEVKMLHNGKIHGDIVFSSNHFEFIGYMKEMRRFTLNGIDSENKANTILANDCYLTSYHGEKCKFSVHKIQWNPKELEKTTRKKLTFRLSVVNVYATFRVEVETELGTVYLQQYERHEQLEQLMREYKIPLITSALTLPLKSTPNKKIREISKETLEVLEKFLIVTSLSQTCWHAWTIVDIYKQVSNTDKSRLIYRELRSPKLKPPQYRQLTNPAHSRTFISNAWKGYINRNDKLGFDFALEWYIESNSANLDVTKFILATTCLELLVSKFNSQGLNEKSSSEDQSEKLYRSVRRHISRYLKEKRVDNKIIVKMCKQLARRQSYDQNIKKLLEYWGISITDIQTPLSDIIKVRDKIIHKGLYFHDEDPDKARMVFRVSEDLFHILTRILLAMIKYDDQYYYPPESRWIKFSDVCNKIHSPALSKTVQ